MAVTMQQLADKARVPLIDDSKVRYADSELHGYAIDGLRILRSKRPDLYFNNYLVVLSTLQPASSFPIDDEFVPAIADYVTARAHAKEDEAAVQAKAQAFFALFREQAS